MTHILIETLGCKLNQAESENIRRDLAAAGYRIVAPGETADLFILNTCTVTHVADRKARQSVRAAVKVSPGIAVIVTGCYAERDREALGKLPNIRAVMGNEAKENIAAELLRLGFTPSIDVSPIVPGRNRSLIKIQDGCDHRCAYCIVPLVRPEKSCVPADSVVALVKERQAEGCREVVLTGSEIGEYLSCDTELTGLIARVLAETAIERIRISSLQPQEVTQELVELWHDKRLCRHFHLSLQSGSDTILGRMRRRYTTAGYRAAVDLIRENIPGAAITTDVIAGFPGETGPEFEDSFAFIESMGFARLHIFPYSPRPGTAAAAMPDHVDDKTAGEWVKRLLAHGRRSVAEFERRFKGQTFDVLFEGKEGDKWVGYTDNYIRVAVESEEPLANRIIEVRL